MASNPSYGNGYVLREFNIINQIIPPAGAITTIFVDVSRFQSFTLLYFNNNQSHVVEFFSANTPIFNTQHYIIQLLSAPPNTNLVNLGTFPIRSRYLRVIFPGNPGQLISAQLLFS
jgi:hypothetical protein